MICTVPCTGSVLREHSTCMAHRHHDHLHTASTRPGLLVYAFVYPTGLDGTIGDLVLLRGLHSHGRSTLAHPSSIALINFDASVRQEHNSSQDRPLPGSHKVRLRNRLSLAVLLGSRNLPGSVTVRNCISLNGLPLPLRCLSLAVHLFSLPLGQRRPARDGRVAARRIAARPTGTVRRQLSLVSLALATGFAKGPFVQMPARS